ncbi:MAG: GIY-YIG nuclease family protein [Patescibacteria group bacterium]
MEKEYFVYILANHRNGTLYIGITNDLQRRISEHRSSGVDSFTGRHHLYRLVYYEITNSITTALNREKRLKKWKRDWKIDLIENTNPSWCDLLSGSPGQAGG